MLAYSCVAAVEYSKTKTELTDIAVFTDTIVFLDIFYFPQRVEELAICDAILDGHYG